MDAETVASEATEIEANNNNNEHIINKDNINNDNNDDDEGEAQTFYRPDLPPAIYRLVKKLWNLLDKKGKGFLRVSDFIRLGTAMTEEKPTIAAAEMQLNQANISGSGRVDCDEWMGYCERLKSMPQDLCEIQLTAFVARLEKINAKELSDLTKIGKKGDMAEAREEAAMEREIARMMQQAQGKKR